MPGYLKHTGRQRPTILLRFRFRAEDIMYGILAAGRQFGWRLLDLELTRETIPDNCSPAGAIVDLLPDHPLVLKLQDMGCPVVRAGRLPHPLDNQVPAVIHDFAERCEFYLDAD